tara:strand:- start:218313 stop:218492 length:180 start_codon:yes stop_codon:yes gene_type:complete
LEKNNPTLSKGWQLLFSIYNILRKTHSRNRLNTSKLNAIIYNIKIKEDAIGTTRKLIVK